MLVFRNFLGGWLSGVRIAFKVFPPRFHDEDINHFNFVLELLMGLFVRVWKIDIWGEGGK